MIFYRPISVIKLKDLVAKQPVIAGMNFIDSLELYKGDVISESECKDKDNGPNTHAVVIVGYSDKTSTKCKKGYWIVKNSHGTNWGESGYMLLCFPADGDLSTYQKGTCNIQS